MASFERNEKNQKLWSIILKQQELIKRLTAGGLSKDDEQTSHLISDEIEKVKQIEDAGEIGEVEGLAEIVKISIPDSIGVDCQNQDDESRESIVDNTKISLAEAQYSEPAEDMVKPDLPSNLPSQTIIQEPLIAMRGDSRVLDLTSLFGVTAHPVKIQIKKGGNNAGMSFTLQIMAEGRLIGFIEKGRPKFQAIEQLLRAKVPSATDQLGALPEKSLFAATADGRATGILLQTWISNAIFNFSDFTPLLDFLRTNVVAAPIFKESFRKQGNLTKKGNYFGGWKTRHFNLDSSSGTVFYADVSQSEILGSFSLQYAYVISQLGTKKDGDTADRPGFVILEYKKGFFSSPPLDGKNADGLPNGKIDVRHVFYAEKLQDRDSWVRCLSGVISKLRPTDSVAKELFEKTNLPSEKDMSLSIESISTRSSVATPTNLAKDRVTANREWEEVQRMPLLQIRKDSVEKVEKVHPGSELSSAVSGSPSEPVLESRDSSVRANQRGRPVGIMSPFSSTPLALISNGPLARHVDDQSRCLLQDIPLTLTEELDLSPIKLTSDGSKKKQNKGKFADWMKRVNSADLKPAQIKSSRPLFGVTIQEAGSAYGIKDGVEIPAIVFRCIEYLDNKLEEGIYRLSGASSVISALRLRFEEGFIYQWTDSLEGDFSLLEGDVYYDPHAVAGLLKLFFRELSEPLFTFQLRMNFFQVSDIQDRAEKIKEVARLVACLPQANYANLRSLLAHLLRIVQKSDINKMTARNVSIVFSPTLGVPAGLFTLMLAEFSSIFIWSPKDYTRDLGYTKTVPTLSEAPNPTTPVTVESTQEKERDSIPAAVSQSVATAVNSTFNDAKPFDSFMTENAQELLPPTTNN